MGPLKAITSCCSRFPIKVVELANRMDAFILKQLQKMNCICHQAWRRLALFTVTWCTQHVMLICSTFFFFYFRRFVLNIAVRNGKRRNTGLDEKLQAFGSLHSVKNSIPPACHTCKPRPFTVPCCAMRALQNLIAVA